MLSFVRDVLPAKRLLVIQLLLQISDPFEIVKAGELSHSAESLAQEFLLIIREGFGEKGNSLIGIAYNVLPSHYETVIDVHVERRESHINKVELDGSLADFAIPVPHQPFIALLAQVRA